MRVPGGLGMMWLEPDFVDVVAAAAAVGGTECFVVVVVVDYDVDSGVEHVVVGVCVHTTG